MNTVKVIFFSKIRSITKEREIRLTVKEEETINTLLSELIKRFGEEFRNLLFDTNGKLYPKIIIRHNGENIVTKKGLDTEINNGDAILIMPAVAGG